MGKRVADAVRVQPDMELVGVSDVTADYRIKTADVLALPIYASLPLVDVGPHSLDAYRGVAPEARAPHASFDRVTYSFCADACRNQFLENPAHFVGRRQAQVEGQDGRRVD
jgi:YHS domain-containing protein